MCKLANRNICYNLENPFKTIPNMEAATGNSPGNSLVWVQREHKHADLWDIITFSTADFEALSTKSWTSL